MTFRVQDGEGAQALDLNQLLTRLKGDGVISGGKTTAVGGQYNVEVEAVEVRLNETVHSLQAQQFDLSDHVESDPRKVIIYVDTNGELVVAGGTPEEPQPKDEYRWDCYRPAPPDLSETDAVPLAEIWVAPDDIRITDADIRDRRVDAEFDIHSINAETVDVEELIDGAGVSHTGELATAGEIQTDDDIRDIINGDDDHGSMAPHNYFSGNHEDLTGVQDSQHHSRYVDSEARNAVRGNVELSELTAVNGADGQFIEALGGEAVWVDPPNQQAQEIASGTVTHTGGSSTTALLAGVSTDQTALFKVAVGVAQDPTWDGNYAFSMDTSRQWDDTNGELDIELTLTWDTDPGAGNDLNLAWSVFETAPVVVEGRYTDSDAIDAVNGASITPDHLDALSRLRAPIYSHVDNVTGMETGDIVISDGTGSSPFGQFIYDGTNWLGPIGTGVESLSELNIDSQKNWNGHRITNLGGPSNSTDAARLQELNNHANTSDAHHAKTTSSDIDHSQVQNVQSGQHHERYQDAEAAEAAAGRITSSTLTGAAIPGGQYLRNFHRIVSGETLELYRTELLDEEGVTPSGLEIQLYGKGEDIVYFSSTQEVEKGTYDNPLYTLKGPENIEVRIYNGTGNEIAASGSMSFALQ